jgi:flagellar hook-associated protein 3 FlgL
MTTLNISFLGQTTAQQSRLKDLGATLADLERQISTGKKCDTLAGFGGVVAQTVQRVRIDRNHIQTYLDNITMATNRIDQMNQALTSAQTAVKQVTDGIAQALHDSSADVPNLVTLAKNALAFVEDLANLNVDGRYLFAGSDTTSAPFQDNTALNNNMSAQVTAWLNGTNTTTQFQSNVDALSASQLGLNPALSSAGSVSVQVDASTNVDYTVNAGQDGFQEIIRALSLMANLKVPGPGDIPDTAQLNDMLTKVQQIANNGVDQLTQAQTQLGMKSALINSIQDIQTKDKATLENVMGNTENTDTTDAVTKIQALQTQLQSSYEVTSIISKLSLVNFL